MHSYVNHSMLFSMQVYFYNIIDDQNIEKYSAHTQYGQKLLVMFNFRFFVKYLEKHCLDYFPTLAM